MRVAVIAFGTRGDVQPLVVLAAGLKQRAPWCTDVVLATHNSFRSLVHLLAVDVDTDCRSRDNKSPQDASPVDRFVAIDSPPVLWKGLAESDAAEASANRAQEDGCLEACRGAGLIVFNMFAMEAYHVAEKMRVPCAVCHPYLPTTPMPASFPRKMRRAYPGLFRSLITLPSVPDSKRPPSSGVLIGSSLDADRRSTSSGSIATDNHHGDRSSIASIATEPAWAHVEHWMWPLFTDRWGQFRERLGLHPCPLMAGVDAVALPASGPVVAAADEDRRIRPTGTPVDDAPGMRLPMVLYLLSSLVVDSSPFWPCGVKLCGYLYPSARDVTALGKRAEDAIAERQHHGFQEASPRSRPQPSVLIEPTAPSAGQVSAGLLPNDVEAFLSAGRDTDRPIYLGFGSMWGMCPPGYGLAFAVRVMLLGMRQASRRCLLVLPLLEDEEVSGAWDTLDIGRRRARGKDEKSELDIAGEMLRDEFSPPVGRNDLLVHRGPLDHGLVLPRCSLAIHHGGSGTTAAVLRAGIPHDATAVWLVEDGVPQLRASSELQLGALREVVARERQETLSRRAWWGAAALYRGQQGAANGQDSWGVFQGCTGLWMAGCWLACRLHQLKASTSMDLGVICPQQLDQFFWAERVRYLSLGSVMERSLFTRHESSLNTPPASASLVSKAASAILSTLTPQVRLRAACLGVKIRAEDGLQNALDALFLYIAGHGRLASPLPHPPNGTALSPLRNASSMSSKPSTKPSTKPSSSRRDSGELEACPKEQPRGSRNLTPEVIARHECLERATVDETPAVGFSRGELVLREMPNGVSVWCGAQSLEETLFIYGEVFEDRTYARKGLRVQDGDTVWDIGANVGLSSIFFELEADTPDAVQLYAFEPIPLNRAALQRNLSEHCPRAVVLGYALGAKNEDGALATFYPRMPGNSTFRPKEKEQIQGEWMRRASSSEAHRKGFFEDVEQVVCEVRTVSWAMSSLGVDKIDLLKVDVEGAELDVLHGVREKDWPKIRQVVVEVHPVEDRLARACALLRAQGFEVTTQALSLDGTPLSIALAQQRSPPCTSGGSNGNVPANPSDRSNADICQEPGTQYGTQISEISHGYDGNGGYDAAADGVVFMLYAKR